MEYDYLIVGIKEREAVKMKITTEDKYVQLYENFNRVLDELDKCAVRFALFIGQQMDEHNQIELTGVFKKKFMEFTNQRYTINSVNAAVKKLKSVYFLAPLAARQHYLINPVYMYKSKLNNRFNTAKKFRISIIDYYKTEEINWDLLNEYIRDNTDRTIS